MERLELPPVIFGTSSLGNLYQAIPYETKQAIVRECVVNSPGLPVFDSAGKYGAGLALQMLGQTLADLHVDPKNVIISNKLGWYQTKLTTPEPTFEKGVWKDLKNDAVQKISYKGILDCFHQGNDLLGNYDAQMVSIHDPDEYMAHATTKKESEKLYYDILEAYQALSELRQQGKVASIGVGSKHWEVIKRISEDVELDWIMVANSLTLKSHPKALMDFIAALYKKNVSIINSAVFNGGFLVGSDFYDYNKVNRATPEGKELYDWRDAFFAICEKFGVLPGEACFNFGFNIPGVTSVALSTSNPEKVKGNIAMATKKVPVEFWDAMKENGLLETDIFF